MSAFDINEVLGAVAVSLRAPLFEFDSCGHYVWCHPDCEQALVLRLRIRLPRAIRLPVLG